MTQIGHLFKRYTPIGVVGAISPWNLPVILSFAKALAALLVGNTVVLNRHRLRHLPYSEFPTTFVKFCP